MMSFGWVLEEEERDTQREDGHVTTEAEIGVRQLQAKECQGLTATTGSSKARKDSSQNLTGSMTLPTP